MVSRQVLAAGFVKLCRRIEVEIDLASGHPQQVLLRLPSSSVLVPRRSGATQGHVAYEA